MPHKDPEARRMYQFKRNLKRRYNITIEEYEKLYHEQNGCCALCGKNPHRHEHWMFKNLGVDHDHKTGKIRGLLCVHCNRNIIGSIDTIGLDKITDYIKKGV